MSEPETGVKVQVMVEISCSKRCVRSPGNEEKKFEWIMGMCSKTSTSPYKPIDL